MRPRGPTSVLAQAFSGPVLGKALIVNAVLFALFWALFGWWTWFAFWLLPLLTWFQLVLRVRNIATFLAAPCSLKPAACAPWP